MAIGAREGDSAEMRVITAFLVGFLVAAALPAHADTVLITPVLRTFGGSSRMICEMLSIGRGPLTVVVGLRGPSGGDPGSPFTFDIDPATSQGIQRATLGSEARYCRFPGQFNKTTVRATGAVYEDGKLHVLVKAE